MSPQELPKISALTQLLAIPETHFESMVREIFRIELPPGPQSMLLKIQSSIEAGRAPELPALEFKAPRIEEIAMKLPKLPKLEEAAPKCVERVEETAPPAEEAAEEGMVF